MGTKLYIRNLCDATDSYVLEEMFSAIGEVKKASVAVKSVRGNDYHVGYVEMATPEEAADGIQRFHGHKMSDGSTLVVTEDVPHVSPPSLTVKKTPLRAKARSRRI